MSLPYIMVFLLTYVRLIDIPVLYKPSSKALAPTNEISGSVVSRAPGLIRFRFVFQVACSQTDRNRRKAIVICPYSLGTVESSVLLATFCFDSLVR